jgi:hypothetical protein
MEDPNEPRAPPEGGASGDGEEPEQKRAREVLRIKHYVNDLFAAFDKNKNLIAKTLAYLNPIEIFVITREATGDLAFSRHKKLWKSIATEKFGLKRRMNLEILLIYTDPFRPTSTALVSSADEIDYFKLMLTEYIISKIIRFKRGNDPMDIESMKRQIPQWMSQKNYFSKEINFVFDFRNEQFKYEHILALDPSTNQVVSGHYFTNLGSFAQNWITKILHTVLGTDHFDRIKHSESYLYAFKINETDTWTTFRIIYGILQIPGVSLAIKYKLEDGSKSVISVANKVTF